MCTDGLANVGLGSIEDCDMPADAPADATPATIAEQFYTRVGSYAVTNGSTIDVIGYVHAPLATALAACASENLNHLFIRP